MHTLDEEAETVELQVPAGQSRQTVFAVEPSLAVYRPAGHDWHVVTEVCEKPPELKVPAAQLTQEMLPVPEEEE